MNYNPPSFIRGQWEERQDWSLRGDRLCKHWDLKCFFSVKRKDHPRAPTEQKVLFLDFFFNVDRQSYRESQRQKFFICWFPLPVAINSWSKPKRGARNSIRAAHVGGRGPKHLGHLPLLSHVRYHWAGSEVKQLQLKLSPITGCQSHGRRLNQMHCNADLYFWNSQLK